jgi:hypothetical protein
MVSTGDVARPTLKLRPHRLPRQPEAQRHAATPSGRGGIVGVRVRRIVSASSVGAGFTVDAAVSTDDVIAYD